MEFQGTIAATSALSDNIASKKKKKRGGEERIFFAFLIGWRTILQKISGDFQSVPMVRIGACAPPSDCKKEYVTRVLYL